MNKEDALRLAQLLADRDDKWYEVWVEHRSTKSLYYVILSGVPSNEHAVFYIAVMPGRDTNE